MEDEDNKVVKNNNNEEEEEEKGMLLPGFRFHPTDEELVGFYLTRKVQKKTLRIELIKHIDVYKYDPWDLPKASGSVGEKEWYFFCKRGRKYRNSVRPNRVTASGFWKATGIDKSIYDNALAQCIGLKKSLVYYKGSAGKGTKTDWMMHEFRLPPNNPTTTSHLQEAEVWTLCRIFKRIPSYRKYTPNPKDTRKETIDSTNSKALEFNKYYNNDDNNNNNKPYSSTCFGSSSSSSDSIITHHDLNDESRSQFFLSHLAPDHQAPSSVGTNNGYYNLNFLNHHQNVEDVLANGNWDELRSVVQFDVDHHHSTVI